MHSGCVSFPINRVYIAQIHTMSDLDDSRRRRKGMKAEGVMQEAVQFAEDVVLQLAEDAVRVARYNTMSCSFPRYE